MPSEDTVVFFNFHLSLLQISHTAKRAKTPHSPCLSVSVMINIYLLSATYSVVRHQNGAFSTAKLLRVRHGWIDQLNVSIKISSQLYLRSWLIPNFPYLTGAKLLIKFHQCSMRPQWINSHKMDFWKRCCTQVITQNFPRFILPQIIREHDLFQMKCDSAEQNHESSQLQRSLDTMQYNTRYRISNRRKMTTNNYNEEAATVILGALVRDLGLVCKSKPSPSNVFFEWCQLCRVVAVTSPTMCVV